MLVIRADLVDAMVAHARADHPDEACGVIAGPEESDRPERFIAMLNAERSPTFYRFDSGEQLKVWRAMDDADEAPVVIVSRGFAERYWPNQDAIGKRLKLARFEADAPWRHVIGIVNDVQHAELAGHPRPAVYYPYAQGPTADMQIVVRAASSPSAAAPAGRKSWSASSGIA